MCAERGGAVRTLAFDSKRYVGAQIGIHNPQGEKVGEVSRLRNVEYVVSRCDREPVGTVEQRSSVQIEGNVAARNRRGVGVG